MPKSSASARRSNHWIGNAFLAGCSAPSTAGVRDLGRTHT
jgi:hypothetical protein